MEFAGFKVVPLEGRFVEVAEQRAVAEIVQEAKVMEHVPRAAEIVVEVGRRVAGGTPVVAAHKEWQESHFPKIETPPSLPRQPTDAKTPYELVHVTICLINRRTPGMGSHFGFEGYFLSLLVSLDEKKIWDARGEEAK
jgi:hypothetical protein